jgi:uncharacterized protein (DUF4213/DUF364 family)
MSIYEDLFQAMTPGLVAENVVIGPFLTAVSAGDQCGLATTLRPKGYARLAPAVENPGRYAGQPLAELARLVFSGQIMEASLGMAAINAGLPKRGLELIEKNGADHLRERAEYCNLVMVGHFSFGHEISPITASTVILEYDPREGDFPASAAESVIPKADVVAITGAAFSNRTIERLLELSRKKWVMVIGPTAPVSPVVLAHGVSAIAGADVTDVPLTLRQVAEGAVVKQLTGARRVMLVK